METFLATAKMPMVCIMLANATHWDWEIEHVDVKSAYSNVFMVKMGFKQSEIDYLVFYWQNNEEHTIVAVATDNMAATSKERLTSKDSSPRSRDN